jgi:hypothetical protein
MQERGVGRVEIVTRSSSRRHDDCRVPQDSCPVRMTNEAARYARFHMRSSWLARCKLPPQGEIVMVPASRLRPPPCPSASPEGTDGDRWEELEQAWRDADLGDRPPAWLREFPEQVRALLEDLDPSLPVGEPPSYRSEVRGLLDAVRKKQAR